MIVQVGPYPLPIGGVSVYVKRMKERLDLEGLGNEVWDTRNDKPQGENVFPVSLRYVPLRYLARRDVNVIHFSVTGVRRKLYLAIFNRTIFRRRHHKLLTIHGEAEHLYQGCSALKMTKALNSFDLIICCRAGDANFLRQQGIERELHEIPAFVPPIPKQEDVLELGGDVVGFIESHSPIISANASRIAFFNGHDLYGLDMCVDLCAALKGDYPRLGFVFCLPEVGDHAYFRQITQSLLDRDLMQNFLFVTRPCQFYPVIMRSDLFVRPTNTDGDAVSLRESLYFKVPSLASDVAPRPVGSIVFPTRDIAQFVEKARGVMRNLQKWKQDMEKVQVEDSGSRLLEIYGRLCSSHMP